jgi:O-succinylbenzoate synthase
MACLSADAAAREEGRSLFDGLEVPESHATLPDLNDEAVTQALERGFSTVKAKARGNGADVMKEIRRLRNEWPALKWRVDFNEGGNGKALRDELSVWSKEEKQAIDFLEDPIPYHGGEWESFGEACGIALANDRRVEDERGDSQVLVFKPAVNDLRTGQEPRQGRVVVTSYMDHPLGQAFTAWEAARAGVTEVCGLQTHGIFKPDEFTERLGEVGPGFHVPEGTGLGFDDLLESLPWSRFEA